MLRSEPNTNISRDFKLNNKLAIINQSEFHVKYEAHIYESKDQIKIDNDISKSKLLRIEQGIVPSNNKNYIAVCGSKTVRIKYFYINLITMTLYH